MESVILSTPLLWIGYGIALFLCVCEIIKKATGHVFFVLSLILVLGSTIYALILNASYYEVGIVILIFLIINLLPHLKGDGSGGEGGKDK